MARPKATNPRVTTTVALTPRHVEILERIDHDLYTGKRRKGARNRHLDIALEDYFQKHYPQFISKGASPHDIPNK